MSKIILVPLESVESRYTFFWKEHLPKMMIDNVSPNIVVVNVDDECKPATDGAFLNFAYTNVFKSRQAEHIAKMFATHQIEDGDVFLFADAWNPAILQTRYMIELLNIKAKIASVWHAGSYDPQDFLGRCIKNKAWSFNAERSMFYASDMNFFATEFHLKMLKKTLMVKDVNNCCVTGFPMEYIADKCYSSNDKTYITFPHRIAPEKNINLFKQLQSMLPQYEFVVCQEKQLSKEQYYEVLSKTKILFSANLQETLGIGVFEGLASGAFPLVPNNLSYKEMYPAEFKYSATYMNDVERLAKLIDIIMKSDFDVANAKENVFKKYFCGDEMYKTLKQMLGSKT